MGLLGVAGPQHSILLNIAHETIFYERVRNDVNRVNDGLELRDEFVETTGNTRPIIVSKKRSCTMLEMMIALSRRINDLNYDPTDPDRTAHWFWILIDNLNLSDFSDRNMNVAAEAATYDTFKRVVERTYGANGIGGLFPLLSAKQDQRRVEIWFQMQSWAMIFV